MVALAFDVFGDGGDGETDRSESEIVGNESTPAGSAKLNWANGSRSRSAHIFTRFYSGSSVKRQQRGEKRGKGVGARMPL